MHRVWVTGLGVVSALGRDVESFWQALIRGEDAAKPVTAFSTEALSRHYACEVHGFDPSEYLDPAEERTLGRCGAFALVAARQAMSNAGWFGQTSSSRGALIMGTTMGEPRILSDLQDRWFFREPNTLRRRTILRYGTGLIPLHLSRQLGIRGRAVCLPAACAAGNYAIGYAADLIRSGVVDYAIAGASETLERLQFEGFVRLGAMAESRCQPFELHRKGLLLGEGAGFMMLESEAHARKRDQRPLAEVGGYGIACDAHHITRPHPEGTGNIRAFELALSTSRLQPSEVDFVNAHGTGTPSNDSAESQVLHHVFPGKVPNVSSIKSMLGHCMGAASALEAVSCVLTLEHQTLPPTIHYHHADPECSLPIVANQPLRQSTSVVLNNSLAFGGYDAVVCFALPDRLPEYQPIAAAPPSADRPILAGEQ